MLRLNLDFLESDGFFQILVGFRLSYLTFKFYIAVFNELNLCDINQAILKNFFKYTICKLEICKFVTTFKNNPFTFLTENRAWMLLHFHYRCLLLRVVASVC